MGFSTFVFLIVLHLALSLPQPDPNVKVVVDVDVDDRGCGCCNNENCCTYDDVKYRSGYNLVVGCVELCCKRDGDWEFKGIIPGCGNCKVYEEPWVKTFDDVTGAQFNQNYWTNATGKYVLTQQGVTATPDYEVIGEFSHLSHNGWDGSYINGVTYKERSLRVISLTCDPSGGWGCTNILVTPSSIPVLSYMRGGRNCKVFVGTPGLTVVMCGSLPGVLVAYLPWVDIYAPESLKASSSGLSRLYGLCNTFTGHEVDFYTKGPYTIGPGVSFTNCFKGLQPTDHPYDIDIKCNDFTKSWKV